MKLTVGAFEVIYRACAPDERKRFFGDVIKTAEFTNKAVIVRPPAMTGSGRAEILLRRCEDGTYDI